MIGFHYTSLKCWKKIKIQGIRPYTIHKHELYEYIGTMETVGIWIWQERFYRLPHIGSIIYQMAHKNETKAVLLSVVYNRRRILKVKTGDIVLSHSGYIENLVYHDGKQKAVIYKDRIYPSKIDLIEEYDLLDIWTS